jgi:hypothetical protein
MKSSVLMMTELAPQRVYHQTIHDMEATSSEVQNWQMPLSDIIACFPRIQLLNSAKEMNKGS